MNDLQQTQETWKKLTPREIEIVKAAGEGKSIKQTAESFGLQRCTIATHRHSVIKKLGCGNITRAVDRLIRAGVI